MEDFGYPPNFPEESAPVVEKEKDFEAGKWFDYHWTLSKYYNST